MRKYKQILILVSILIIWGCFLLFYKIRDLDFSSNFETKFLMRNLTWQTDFKDIIPYKKWDEIEYTWIFSGNFPRDISMDITSLKEAINIESITLDEQKIEEKDLNTLYVKDASLLKIIGKAKNTSDNAPVQQPEIITKKSKGKKEEKKIPSPILGENPTDIVLDNTKYNSNINNLLKIQGKNLESIEFINIGEKRIRPVYSSGTLFVHIDHDTFIAGEYFVFFTLKNGKILTSDYRLSFEYTNSLINIANLTPKSVRNDMDRFIVIQGNGLDKIISIQLSNNTILKNTEFNIINNQVAGIKIPKNLPPGEYSFNIMDTTSIYELKNMKFTITN